MILNGLPQHLRHAFGVQSLVARKACSSIKSVISDQYGACAVAAGVRLHEAANATGLAIEGLTHIGAAPGEVKQALARDSATLVIESSLAVAADLVTPELNVAVATTEAAEKVIDGSREKINLVHLAAEFCESVVSNASAAVHAAICVFNDLEASGLAWREAHPQPVAVAAHPHFVRARGSSFASFN